MPRSKAAPLRQTKTENGQGSIKAKPAHYPSARVAACNQAAVTRAPPHLNGEEKMGAFDSSQGVRGI
jgi:hypothetical protein